jgi:threonine dehydrogenase-like Zn-dependent dehydrogenase
VNAVCASDARYIESGNQNPGHEAVGIVEALGEDVTNVSVGDRVAFSLASDVVSAVTV